MANVVVNDLLPTDVVVTYGTSGSSSTPAHHKIVLEMDDRYDEERLTLGIVRIRHYPSGLGALSTVGFGAVPLTRGVAGVFYRCIKGVFEWTNEYRSREVFGTVEFNGTDKVSLPYPVESWMSAYFGKSSAFYDMQGNDYGNSPGLGYALDPLGGFPTVRFNESTQELIAQVPCFGTVEYRYTATYRVIRYQPTLNTRYGFGLQAFWNADSYGKLDAVETSPTGEKFTTSLQIQPVDTPSHEVELYRIEYSVLVNNEGTWETPLSFPANALYPGTSPAQSFDTDTSYMKVNRLLEIAYFSLSDPTTRIEANARTSTRTPVPLNFSALERSSAVQGAVNTVGERVVSVEKFARDNRDYYKDMRNRPPPVMRIDTFTFNLSRPYSGIDNAVKGLEQQGWRNRRWQKTGETSGFWIETSKTFKVTIRIVPGKLPLEVAAPPSSSLVSGAVTADEYQTLHTNSAIYKAWKVIDWLTIWESIKKRYPDTVYAYDSAEITALISSSNARPSI